MSEKELVAELELAACCGTPPYTPDTLMEIEVSEHSVRAFLPAEYARPRRLTPAEGFAVAASARLLLAVPGSEDDALRRALAKLDAALGSREVVGLDVDAPVHLGAVRAAADDGHAVEIDYVSGSRDEQTTRVVEPVQVVTIDGHWYLDAYCHRAGDVRRFRVDRIGAVGRGLGGRRRRRASGAELAVRSRPLEEMFVPGPGAVEVQVQLGPGGSMGRRVHSGAGRGAGRRRDGDRHRARRLRNGVVRAAAAAARSFGAGGRPARADRAGGGGGQEGSGSLSSVPAMGKADFNAGVIEEFRANKGKVAALRRTRRWCC